MNFWKMSMQKIKNVESRNIIRNSSKPQKVINQKTNQTLFQTVFGGQKLFPKLFQICLGGQKLFQKINISGFCFLRLLAGYYVDVCSRRHNWLCAISQGQRLCPVPQCHVQSRGGTFCSSAPTALWETRHDNYEEAVEVHKD